MVDQKLALQPGAGGRVPSDTYYREISADLLGKKRQEQKGGNGEEKKENKP